MRIAVAVSGGTDSLFALLKLREEGHDVVALHARFLPPCAGVVSDAPNFADPVPGLTTLCARLNISLRVVDLAKDFDRLVIRPFIQAHILARTPNPCALCNRTMKFGLLLDAALQDKKTDAMATGHYVALENHPAYGLTPRAGTDGTKDQSYFLALTPIDRLRRCVFPLAGEHKTDIRAWLRHHDFEPPLPHESQEICFVPHDDHRAFLLNREDANISDRTGGLPGPVLLDAPGYTGFPGNGGARPAQRREIGGMPIIAEHLGLWRYTEGQRKGLGIAWSEPLFVLRRDRKLNALVVGPQSRLTNRDCEAADVNFLVPPALWPARVLARIRYRQSPCVAKITMISAGAGPRLHLRFAEPQLPPAPGQVAAVYDDDGFLLAGGVLCEQNSLDIGS